MERPPGVMTPTVTTYFAECPHGCGTFGSYDDLDDAVKSAERHYAVSGHDARVDSRPADDSPQVTALRAEVDQWMDKYREADRAYIRANEEAHRQRERALVAESAVRQVRALIVEWSPIDAFTSWKVHQLPRLRRAVGDGNDV